MSDGEEIGNITNDVNQFIQTTWDSVSKILDQLGWTANNICIENSDNLTVCPLDPGHRMKSTSVTKHVQTCSWVKSGYSKDELVKLPSSSEFFYEESEAIIPFKLTRSVQSEILRKAAVEGGSTVDDRPVALTPDRETVELSARQRLAIYDHVVQHARATNPAWGALKVDQLQLPSAAEPNFSRLKDGDKPKSQLELMKEQRDYKRRRQSYRAKNVHITKKSYTEVMREVIENQMGFLRHMRGDDSEGESVDGEGVSSRGNSPHHKEERSREESRGNTPQRKEGRSREESRENYPHHKEGRRREESRGNSPQGTSRERVDARRRDRSRSPYRHQRHKTEHSDTSPGRQRHHKRVPAPRDPPPSYHRERSPAQRRVSSGRRRNSRCDVLEEGEIDMASEQRHGTSRHPATAESRYYDSDSGSSRTSLKKRKRSHKKKHKKKSHKEDLSS